MTEVTKDAIAAAAKVLADWWGGYGVAPDADDIDVTTRMLAAAAPLIVSHRETATAAAIAKAERERLLAAVTRFKTVLGQPVNGYLADAVPFAAILDVFAALPEG
jgi:hypothetical protein